MKVQLKLVCIALLSASLLGFARHSQSCHALSEESESIIGSQDQAEVAAWFDRYDSIRRKAKMSLREKLKLMPLLNAPLGALGLGVDDSKRALQNLAPRYEEAARRMSELPKLSATETLRIGYLKYFTDARQLFLDTAHAPEEAVEYKNYLADLVRRKHELEKLDETNKALDANLRKRFGVAPMRG